jgi:hypothetical protein
MSFNDLQASELPVYLRFAEVFEWTDRSCSHPRRSPLLD